MLTLLLSVLIHACVTTVLPLIIDPPPMLISLDILHPIGFWMHLSVSALDYENESSNDHYRFINFFFTTTARPWSVYLESLFCNMAAVFLKLVFVVVVGT